MTEDQLEVVFVRVHNAGRSQIAAALLDAMRQVHVTVRSAGSASADQINPTVIRAMAEVGLDLSNAFPKPLTDAGLHAADVVITMGCGDACPVYPGKHFVDWELPDPAGQPIETSGVSVTESSNWSKVSRANSISRMARRRLGQHGTRGSSSLQVTPVFCTFAGRFAYQQVRLVNRSLAERGNRCHAWPRRSIPSGVSSAKDCTRSRH